MIVHTHVVKTRLTPEPRHFTRTKGLTYADKRAQILKQLQTVDELLSVTLNLKARANLNSSRGMLIESLNHIDAALARMDMPAPRTVRFLGVSGLRHG